MFRQFLISAMLVVLAVPAVAERQSVTVPANRTTVISEFYVYGENNCHHPGRIQHQIGTKPAHGDISVSFEHRKVPASLKGCAGKTISATIIRYTPKRGYHGSDLVRIHFYFPKYQGDPRPQGDTVTYSVTVK